MARLAIIGGGIGGLATALFAARRGHTVTVFEREPGQPTGDLDRDYFSWQRPRTPQAIQPHVLMAPVRNVLRAEAPDVYAAMLTLGAREENEFDWFPQRPPARPGDDDLVNLRTRRIVLETALSEAVSRQRGIDLRVGEAVDELVLDDDGPTPRVIGVLSESGVCNADLVIDAAGRRSPVGDWLVESGCRPPVVENHNIGIAYFSRWYRTRPDGPRTPGKLWPVAISPFAIGLVFPSDNNTFAVTLALPVTDPTRGALRDPDTFNKVARLYPVCDAWLSLEPQPLTGVHVMAGLDDRWTALVDDDGPVVTGLVGVGDSITHTNPTLGQGAALTLLAAARVAATVDTMDDPSQFATGYFHWAVRTLKPWFDHQVKVDRGDEALFAMAADPNAPRPEISEKTIMHFAVTPCAQEDPTVMRAWAKVRHLVETPDTAFSTEEIRDRLGIWLRDHPEFPSLPPRPTRADWLALTGDTAAVVSS